MEEEPPKPKEAPDSCSNVGNDVAPYSKIRCLGSIQRSCWGSGAAAAKATSRYLLPVSQHCRFQPFPVLF